MKKYLILACAIILSVGCTTKQNIQVNENNEDLKNEALKVAVGHSDFLTENALHDAVRANDLLLVKFFLEEKAFKDQRDKYGFTPLHLAVRLHNIEIVDYLISQKVNLNTLDVYKDTPLLDSTRNNDTQISKILICNGANRNVVDINGMSTLNNSSKNNNKYISQLLRTDNLKEDCAKELEVEEPKAEDIEAQEEPMVAEEEPVIVEDAIEEPIAIEKVLEEPAVLVGLYDALMQEFKNDFQEWDAKLDKENLVIRFNNPSVLFNRGTKDLKEKFTTILSSFIPRYSKILKSYEAEIEKVSVEGHTSSEYSLAKTIEEKYNYNQKLSEKRANEVVTYINSLSSDEIDSNIPWLNNILDGIGKSSSQLVTNEDGTENKELSRRVEIKITTKDKI